MRWPLTAKQLAEMVKGDLHGDPSALAERIITDTRSGVRPADAFLALRGVRFDAIDFVLDAWEAGATVVLAASWLEAPTGCALIVVDDPLAALRRLAHEARQTWSGTVVAITGSNGKTVVKDLLATALGERAWASPMSWNSAVGVPLALIAADPDADIVLIECGISEVGEMERHRVLVQPDIGVFVNVGDAHLEGLRDHATIAMEKASLFKDATQVFVPEDQELAREAVGDRAVIVPVEGDVLEIDRQLAGAVARHFGVTPEELESAWADWRPPPMRLEWMRTPRGVTVLNDAYTSDAQSVLGALAALQREPGSGCSWAVLGGLAQPGRHGDDARARVARGILDHAIDRVVVIGAEGSLLAAALPEGVRVDRCADVRVAADLLSAEVRAGDRVLLKGRRPEKLERLLSVFFTALAPAVLTVDLDGLVENVRRIQSVVSPAALMPVVKAGAYGIDPARVALTLQFAGVAHFGVAYPDEGVQLREAGVVRPILVQNVVPSEMNKLVAHGLSAQVNSLAQIDALSAEAKRQGRSVRVHLKVDTGMGRAGCVPSDAALLAERVHTDGLLVFDGLMTHFASADDEDGDRFTRQQIAVFDEVRRSIPHKPRWVHASNSAGLARFPEATYDMVRSGIALWGYGVSNGRVVTCPVLRLTTRVVSVKTVPPNHPVGYGRTWMTGDQPRTIAVVALGYADGYPRHLSNAGWMSIDGVRCPVVGRVCMDVTMLDVTDVPGVVPGQSVVVYGSAEGEPTLPEMAELAGSIPYELLTRLSARVRRVFEASL